MRVVLTAVGPISHGAFGVSAGNATCFRRLAIVSLAGMPRVPAISGNALRGCMRRLVMRELFHRAELKPADLPGKKWDLLYAALANGGHLTGSETSAKTAAMRTLREALPPLSVFGAALYKYMLPGHMEVGICWPRCSETAEAGLVQAGEYPAAEALVEEVSLCRHIDREHQDPSVTGVTPMPTTMETLSTGTVLETEITFVGHASDVERGVIAHALNGLEWVGAKRASGFGRVKVEHDSDAQPYIDWLAQTPDLRDRLVHLAGTL